MLQELHKTGHGECDATIVEIQNVDCLHLSVLWYITVIN